MRINVSAFFPISLFTAVLIFPLLNAGVAGAQSSATAAPETATGTQIDYTGTLMGYYRMEAGETSADAVLPPVKSFLNSPNAQKDRLLLGMGDNFGPEFGASLQRENLTDAACKQPQNTPSNHETMPESLYKNDDRIAKKAQCDNVLNFMMHAGFRAVVPGREDFMYTATWLRGAARLLATESIQPHGSPLMVNKDGQLYMLAGNLRIALKGKVGKPGSAASSGSSDLTGRCPLLFGASPLGKDSVRCVGDAAQAEPIDLLDRLDRLNRGNGNNATIQALRELATEPAEEAAGRNAELNSLVRDEVSIMFSAWGARFDLTTLPGNPAAGGGKGNSQELSLTVVDGLIKNLPDLPACKSVPDSDDGKGLCSYIKRLEDVLPKLKESMNGGNLDECKKDKEGLGGCFLLTPDTRSAAIDGLLRTIADEERNVGYTEATLADGGKVLIVGVVGQNTMKAVSETNLRMCIDRAKDGSAPSDFGICDGGSSSDKSQNGLAANVLVTDPIAVTEALVRGAELEDGHFDKIVVMAQMPHTEAEVLAERVWTRLKLAKATQPVDVVLSEADTGYGTPDLTLQFPASVETTHSAPVLTPVDSYSSRDGSYPGTVSRLTLQSEPGQIYSMKNEAHGIFAPPKVTGSVTTVDLLYKLMATLQRPPASPGTSASPTTPDSQDAEFELLKELQASRTPGADVVLLQSRDVELDKIGPDYTNYSMCGDEKVNPDLCRLRVALDRIFWKGDFLEFVAVQGKDLTALLNASQAMMAEQAQLADTGISKEWLISYGVVQSTLTNVTEISQNSEPLWIPVDPSCKGETTGQSTYCVEGTPIVDDAYYWLLTTDQLAEDKAVYRTLQSLPDPNHLNTQMYVTASLAHHLYAQLQDPRTAAEVMQPAKNPEANVENYVTKENETFQQMPLWQVDFSKVIASFTSRQPVGGNQFVGDYFQGVSDSRASAPASQELDLEMASRVSGNFLGRLGGGKALLPVSLGMQSAFSYDRSALGNLSPATKPINASYALNNFTVGAFVQFRLPGRHVQDAVQPVRSLPRNLIVLTPRQYQVQINDQYLFFSFSPPPGELTATLPRNSSWTDRGGFRREFGHSRSRLLPEVGSYFETGMELSAQVNVLSALTLQTTVKGVPTKKTCDASSTLTLQNCFLQAPALPINSTTTVVGSPAVKTLHAPGYYWQLHFQNRLFGSKANQVSLVTDSQGDYYFGRPPAAELPTQTEYAIPLSLSLVFRTYGNLSFAPTYSAFFYKSQLSGQSLQVNSFSIAARWYFARDARVPIRKQIPLQGPESSDQTKTGKAH
jgi:hypothetical protein